MKWKAKINEKKKNFNDVEKLIKKILKIWKKKILE